MRSAILCGADQPGLAKQISNYANYFEANLYRAGTPIARMGIRSCRIHRLRLQSPPPGRASGSPAFSGLPEAPRGHCSAMLWSHRTPRRLFGKRSV